MENNGEIELDNCTAAVPYCLAGRSFKNICNKRAYFIC